VIVGIVVERELMEGYSKLFINSPSFLMEQL